ncbi:MAG: sugar transferase [Clostridia bacterium]|nr:sugar transferase [Clostridia bacterium]
MYKHVVKRFFDIILSGIAIVILALPMLIVAIIIKIDSRGPVFFKQKRVGIHKKTFPILKFRSMPTTVPKDMPTHQFEAHDQLSRWQRFIRKTSIDELPQIFNIFVGQMSICGPRPALWNQDDLIAERDKYGANDIRPGLTGLAQISGRDELEIPVKAKLDGDYAAALNHGRFRGFAMDFKCFFGTFISVLRSDGVVEGGTGEMKKQAKAQENAESAEKREEVTK